MLSVTRHPRRTTPLGGLAGALPDMPWANGHGPRRRAFAGACAVAGVAGGMAARAVLRTQRDKLASVGREAQTPDAAEE